MWVSFYFFLLVFSLSLFLSCRQKTQFILKVLSSSLYVIVLVRHFFPLTLTFFNSDVTNHYSLSSYCNVVSIFRCPRFSHNPVKLGKKWRNTHKRERASQHHQTSNRMTRFPKRKVSQRKPRVTLFRLYPIFQKLKPISFIGRLQGFQMKVCFHRDVWFLFSDTHSLSFSSVSWPSTVSCDTQS